MDIQAIAAHLGEAKANESVTVTLPGAALAFLLRYAEVGLEAADADIDAGLIFNEISEAVDAEVIRTSDQFVSVDEFLARQEADAAEQRKAINRDHDAEFDHAGVWDANGQSLIGGPNLY